MAALCAGVGDHEAAAAVGALRHAWLEARLADQRRLLIAGHAADGDGCAEPLRVGGSEVVDAVAYGGQERGRNVEVVEQPWTPQLALDVEELRARGVGGVRDVAAALGEPPDQEAVHSAELEPPSRCVLSPSWVSKQPFQLRAAEVGVDHEAGDVGDLALHAVVLDAFAALGGAPVLPDDGGVHRVAGLGIPQHGGLALIGDAERVDVRRRDAAAGDRLAASGEGGVPQRLRVLLHPAVVREALIERPLRTRHCPPVGVEDDGAGTRRALVDGEHMAHGKAFLLARGGCGKRSAPRSPDSTRTAPRAEAAIVGLIDKRWAMPACARRFLWRCVCAYCPLVLENAAVERALASPFKNRRACCARDNIMSKTC